MREEWPVSMKKTIYINGSCCLAKLTAYRALLFTISFISVMPKVYQAIVTGVCMVSKKSLNIIRKS